MPTINKDTKLSRPPIYEALIEIRFDPNKDVTLDKIEMLENEIKEDYPLKEALNTYRNTFEVQEGKPKSDINVVPAGFRFMNQKKNRIVIADFEKITVSYLAPYESWPALKNKTEEILSKYLSNVTQNKIIRIGMRYINHIEINDSADFNISKYTNTGPSLAVGDEKISQLDTYETFCVKHFDDIECTSHVRQALIPTDKRETGNFKLVLDIDFFNDNLDLDVTSSSIWDTIDMMREKRNLIFFGTIPSNALKQYL